MWVQIMLFSLPPPPEKFTADQPFIIMLSCSHGGIRRIIVSPLSLPLAPPPPKSFIVDHPFLIVLRSKQDGVSNILFEGRISKP
ncbi:hypothetical protein NQ315_017087 [Exocentrus adspersus]|uniref:Serpin domain-containing protein n=1 Tax=Exocentrus adspersus TaxID=1586481 RepID=A0AAV8VI19_9CUCU|nr:hypothetical protein NQ315_017087 [Exocentrus adspersus]